MHINQYKEKVIETIIEPMLSFMEYWEDDELVIASMINVRG